jgi:hypothetical protein
MKADIWKGVIIKSGGTIDAGPDARERMATLVCYLIAADKMTEAMKAAAWRSFTTARGDESEDLPDPIAGAAYTAKEAKAYFDAAPAKAA